MMSPACSRTPRPRAEPALIVRAGASARRLIEDEGFHPDLFSTLLGASGGPKWLVLSGLDHVIARRLVDGRTTHLHAFGTSIGAFRHTCLAQREPLAALRRFEEAYIAQSYETQPSAHKVTAESERILGVALGGEGEASPLAHPLMKLHVGTVRSRGLVGRESRLPLALGLGLAAGTNALSRRLLGASFERVVFHSTPEPRFSFRDLSTRHVRLDSGNFRAATLASGSIPMVMAGIRDIPGAPPGLYRDGGITDYHFAMDFDAPPGLVFYPHFFDRIVPGWFDKPLTWRKAGGALLDRTVFVAPSPGFVASLPGGKVPDREDFAALSTSERQQRWKAVVAACRRLGEELERLLEGDGLAAAALPFAK